MRRNSIVTSAWLAFALLGATAQLPHAAEVRGYQEDWYSSDRAPTTEGGLIWNTFLGGTGDDWSTAMASDSSGNVYVTGGGDDTWGSPIRPHSGGNDVLVARINKDGYLLWNTFLGGSAADGALAIAVDASGEVYVAGTSDMTWGSPVRAYSGKGDAFVAKLSANGALLWNTFLGGTTTNTVQFLVK